MTRSSDFEYVPLHAYDSGIIAESDFVVATLADLDPAILIQALNSVSDRVVVTSLLNAHPLYWWRVELSHPVESHRLSQTIEAQGIGLRYVASARRGSQQLGVPADFSDARGRRAHAWNERAEGTFVESPSPGRWFMGERGADVDRAVCGSGAGTRLAVIDNDGRDIERTALDSEFLIAVDRIPRATSHAAMLIGWAIGAQQNGRDFVGVAPNGSPRLYCIPKSGEELYALPVAIARAVEDGADVIVCATYVDGLTSPMLDDALEFACQLGRGGKGTAVVLPASREMSSPSGSAHASLSLGMGEPASDPRVFCVGPSSQSGDWFLWRDRRGRLHPFANRGPAVRWIAPGDDMAHPFSEPERPAHAESSGAAGVAAGVLLLVLAQNPELTLSELDTLLTLTCTPLDPESQAKLPDLADSRDLLPLGVDRDGHNAKQGYGRLNATAACLAASDPMSAAMVAIGESNSALAFQRAIRSGKVERLFSVALGNWAARVMLHDTGLWHGLRALARAYRLWTSRPQRASGQAAGAVLRQTLVVLRRLLRVTQPEPPAEVANELVSLEANLRQRLADPRATLEVEAAALARWLSLAVLDSASDARARRDQANPERERPALLTRD